MKAMLKAASALAGLGLTLGAAVQGHAAESRDFVITNADVLTPSGSAEALAVHDGVIVAVGTTADAEAKLPGARRIDLKGAAVMPGLVDSHVHVTFAGLEQFACRIRPGAMAREIAETVKGCVAKAKPGEWINGGNWVAAGFRKGEQNKAFLDRLAPANPVVLVDESHHSLWVNSAALRAAGITRQTPDPAGGVIDRDGKGEPTGLLRETAAGLVYSVVPAPSEEMRRAALKLSTGQMLSYGITAFADAGVTMADVGTLSALSAEGVLKQRVRGCMRWTPLLGDTPEANGMALINARAAYSTPRFRLDCVKVVLDGVPTESRTAYMLDPYLAHGHDDVPTRGLPMITPDRLNPAIAAFDRMGLTVKFHAVGDAAVREAIDSVANARKVNGWGGPSHDVGHNSFVSPEDITRVRDLQMTWEFSPYIWYPTPIASKDIRGVIGDERMKRWIPIRDALETGALVVAGSDWSVVPSVNPWIAIETMVTRQIPGGSAETLGEGQKITLAQALRIFTENGASFLGQRDQFGSIETGMKADFIVVERSPYKVPVNEIHKTKVLQTFIDGEQVYLSAEVTGQGAP